MDESTMFLDTKAAAKMLGLKYRTMSRWRWAGVGPQFRKHGARVVYEKRDLLSWSENRRRRSTSDGGSDGRSKAVANE
ncbi:MAG: helix-turn-helix domain-containing protein [Acidobacteriota bacterium]